MSLAPGTRLGPYEIIAPLGAGGMGEVYRARDTKLARDVALKVLPSEFAIDPDRLARFKREAQVLASLNHPHIAAIYGFEDSEDVHALVLELVDGPTLADRIAHGRLPLDEALPIASQIAEALEAAHEQGIIHRDLKPANIKVRADGAVKVLDFGLAKLIEGTEGPPKSGPHVQNDRLTASPTITTPAMTMAGVILGTAAYMSPEQAKGRPADKRSDIWAVGCVLFEMLSGTRPFGGDDVSDTLAAVLRAEPNWTSLPVDVPERIHGLLRRCLRKDATKRLPHVAMFRYEIEEVASETPVASEPLSIARRSLVRRAVPLASAMVLASALTSAVWWISRPRVPTSIVTRFAIPLGDNDQLSVDPFRAVAISADGSRIAYASNRGLILQSMSTATQKVVVSADDANRIVTPAFSPDGQSLVYVARGLRVGAAGAAIQRIVIDGGPAVTLSQVEQFPLGVDWDEDGIVYGDSARGALRISPNGGKLEVLVAAGKGELIQGASVLPGKSAVLFALATGFQPGAAPTLAVWDAARIVVQTLPGGQRKTLIEGGSDPHYLPTGHLLYVRGGTIFAVPFDVDRLQVTGGPIPVLEGVARSITARTASGFAQFAVSASGSIVYVGGPAQLSDQPRLIVMDRNGVIEALKVPAGVYERPRVSPNGTQVAFNSDDPKSAAIWIYDLSGNSSIRQLTFDGRNRFPVWSADGSYVAFQSDREGDAAIYWQRSDGSAKAERLTRAKPGDTHVPESWSKDGKHFLYSVATGTTQSLWVYSLGSRTGVPFGDVQSGRLISPTFSPDGHWVAYSVLADANQLFVQPFPATGAKYRVGIGARPQWSPDGRELFFFNPNATSVVTVTTSPSFSVSNPTKLPFNVYSGRGPGFGRDVDVMPDGKRFVGIVPPDAGLSGVSGVRQFEVVLNWFEVLKQRVPVK
jgi:eukaryotic-like serine/threonine-protein kinase